MDPVRSGHPGLALPAALLEPLGQFYRQIDPFAHLPGRFRGVIAHPARPVERLEQPVEVFGEEIEDLRAGMGGRRSAKGTGETRPLYPARVSAVR